MTPTDLCTTGPGVVAPPPAPSATPPQTGPPNDAPPRRAAPTVAVVSAHGGSGASTLAAHLPGAFAEVALTAASVLGSDHCVVVASATVDGVLAATDAVRRLGSISSAPVVHLALVRDGRGGAPLGARARIRALSVFVASVTEVPHVVRWRYEVRTQRTPSPAYFSAVSRLAEAVSPTPSTRPRTRLQRHRTALAAGVVS